MSIPINWWAILVTTLISFILGFLWFGPIFGKAWMKTLGLTMPETITPEMKKGMIKGYIIVAIGALIMNFVLLHNLTFGIQYLGFGGIAAGLQGAFWNWLGFVAPATIGSYLWESRPFKHWVITAGYYLVALLINGMILASWM